MNNKHYLVAFLVLAVLVAGCLGGDQATPGQDQQTDTQNDQQTDTQDDQQTDSSGDTNRSEANTLVTYTEDGFRPQTVTIEAGQTVTWENEGSIPMWVASNQHPTHTNYAGSTLEEHCSGSSAIGAVFDSCTARQTYSFVFEQTGQWRYHNHEFAGHGGTVNVQ